MSITRDLKNKAAKRGAYSPDGFAGGPGRPLGKNRPVANHTPFRTTLQRDSVVKLDVHAAS